MKDNNKHYDKTIENRVKQLLNFSILDETNEQGLFLFIEKIKQEQCFQLQSLNLIQSIYQAFKSSNHAFDLMGPQSQILQQLKQAEKIQKQMFLCKQLQSQKEKILNLLQSLPQDIYGFINHQETIQNQIVIPLLEYFENNSEEKSEKLIKYIQKNINILYKSIVEKYQDVVTGFIGNINFPNKLKCDQIKISNYNNQDIIKFIMCISMSLQNSFDLRDIFQEVQKIPEFYILEILNEAFYFHFIDKQQSTSRSDKPEWFFMYIYDILEVNLQILQSLDPNNENQKYQESKNVIAYILYEHYCISNIFIKIQADQQDLFNNPSIAITFIESAYLFEKNIHQIYINVNGIFEKIVVELNKLSILERILQWEMDLFNENLFQIIRNEIAVPIKQRKVNQILSFVHDFIIIWKKMWSKYETLQGSDVYKIIEKFYTNEILKPFVQLLKQDFDLIIQFKEDEKRIQFIQNLVIAIHTLKIEFQSNIIFKDIVIKLKSETINRFVLLIECKISDIIVKDIQKIMLEDCCSILTSHKKFNMYLHQGFYTFEMTDQVGFEAIIQKINDFHFYISKITKSVLDEYLIQRSFNLKMSQKIIKAMIYQLIKKMQEISTKQHLKFSVEGVKLFLLIFLRTPIYCIMIQMSLENSLFCQQQIKRIENMYKLVGEKNQLSDQNIPQNEKEDLQFIQKLNIIYQ